MPDLETTEELIEEIANWIGIYGVCAKETDCQKVTPFCCRTSFTSMLSDRIEQARKNDELLRSSVNDYR